MARLELSQNAINLLHREIEAGERSNLIIAVGDLALRFPNLLEPWTAHIYAPLSDPDTGDYHSALLFLRANSFTHSGLAQLWLQQKRMKLGLHVHIDIPRISAKM